MFYFFSLFDILHLNDVNSGVIVDDRASTRASGRDALARSRAHVRVYALYIKCFNFYFDFIFEKKVNILLLCVCVCISGVACDVFPLRLISLGRATCLLGALK